MDRLGRRNPGWSSRDEETIIENLIGEFMIREPDGNWQRPTQ